MKPSRAGSRLVRVVSTLGVMALAGCSTDKLLEVNTPDQITPDKANSPAGAAALRNAAIGNFAAFFGGDYGGSWHGLNVTAGAFADELESARGGTEFLDTRSLIEGNQPIGSSWSYVGQANTQIIRAIAAMEQYAPESNASEKASKATELARLHALRGFLFTIVAESYCNGVPIGNADDQSPVTEQLSNAELWTRALAQFDTAATILGANGDAAVRNLIAVGRGRTLVDQQKYDAAAAAVASVPTDFVYDVNYSNTSIINSLYDWASVQSTINYGIPDKEGQNGIDWVTANDPRVVVYRDASGAPIRRPGQDGALHYVQQNYTSGEQAVPLATGVEARLIEAEAAIAGGNPTAYLTKLNAARSGGGVAGLAPLTDPGNDAARIDLLFRERGFWMYGTNHRLGDLRRLIRQYGRSQSQVFPVGPYFKGGTYSDEVNLVPAQAERNNPEYAGCTDRKA